MTLAFYAPMKPPDHPVPSGDRTIARSLIAALTHLGADIQVASTIRSRDAKGNAALQNEIMAQAAAEADRLVPLGRTAGWRAWITYHNYYKAPDLIGPAVCRALSIPYLQIESTRAHKRLSGPWAKFAQAAEAATDAADVVFYFTTRDAHSLIEHAPAAQKLIHLRPFLERTDLPVASPLNGAILSVGMMRDGDKLASYKIIAETLALLEPQDWRLRIAGDGSARADVEELMAPFANRIEFLGQLSTAQLQDTYQEASMMLWPGVNEALGLVYIESQAAGLPIIAQERPGMREVLAPSDYPGPEAGSAGLAERLNLLLVDPSKRQRLGQNARTYVEKNHLLPSAAKTLRSGLAHVGIPL